jgi:hypothetical protein
MPGKAEHSKLLFLPKESAIMQAYALRKARSTLGQFHRGSPLQVLCHAASEREIAFNLKPAASSHASSNSSSSAWGLQAILTLTHPPERPLSDSAKNSNRGSADPPTAVYLPPPEPAQVGRSFLIIFDVWVLFWIRRGGTRQG